MKQALQTTKLFWLIYLMIMVVAINNAHAQAPTITSFTPISGKVGDTITVIGTNFNTTSANNIVFLGATRALVHSATNTSLILTVPAGATFAPIIVLNTITSLTAYSAQFFNPIFNPNKGNITNYDFETGVNFTSTNPTNISNGSNMIRDIAVGDLDGDGKPDLAIANTVAKTVSILRNTGSFGVLSFAPKVEFTVGVAPMAIAISDLNGDGKPDLAIVNTGSDNVSVLRNISSIGNITTSSFATKVDFLTGDFPLSIAIGDLDGDGKPDLAVTNESSYTVSILRNSGTLGTMSFEPKVDFITGVDPCSVVIGDLDGDGKHDLAIANKHNNYLNPTISVFRNQGVPGLVSFANKVDFSTGIGPVSIALGDLDGNGKLDLAVGNHYDQTVSVLRNTCTLGALSFAPKLDLNVENTCNNVQKVAIGDMDGDGMPDIVVNSNPYNSLFRNNSFSGFFNFEFRVDITVANGITSMAIGDLNGDGKPDLAFGLPDLPVNNIYSQSTKVSVLKNNPQRTIAIQAFIEGLYLGNEMMVEPFVSIDYCTPLHFSDTITVELHETIAPFANVYSTKTTIGSNGLSNILFPISAIGNLYYLVIKHRNSLETWSSNPILIKEVGTSYNFSDSISKAYGNNLKNMGNGVFGIYSGDINQDGSIDFADYPLLDMASQNGLLGYDSNDLNGDASVDFADYPILDMNSNNAIFSMRP